MEPAYPRNPLTGEPVNLPQPNRPHKTWGVKAIDILPIVYPELGSGQFKKGNAVVKIKKLLYEEGKIVGIIAAPTEPIGHCQEVPVWFDTSFAQASAFVPAVKSAETKGWPLEISVSKQIDERGEPVYKLNDIQQLKTGTIDYHGPVSDKPGFDTRSKIEYRDELYESLRDYYNVVADKMACVRVLEVKSECGRSSENTKKLLVKAKSSDLFVSLLKNNNLASLTEAQKAAIDADNSIEKEKLAQRFQRFVNGKSFSDLLECRFTPNRGLRLNDGTTLARLPMNLLMDDEEQFAVSKKEKAEQPLISARREMIKEALQHPDNKEQLEEYLMHRAVFESIANYYAEVNAKEIEKEGKDTKREKDNLITRLNDQLVKENILIPHLRPDADPNVPGCKAASVGIPLSNKLISDFMKRAMTEMAINSGTEEEKQALTVKEEDRIDLDGKEVKGKEHYLFKREGLNDKNDPLHKYFGDEPDSVDKALLAIYGGAKTPEEALARRVRFIDDSAGVQALENVQKEANYARAQYKIQIPGELEPVDMSKTWAGILEGFAHAFKKFEEHFGASAYGIM